MGGEIKRNKLIKVVAVLPLVILAAIILSSVNLRTAMAADNELMSPDKYGIGIDIDQNERNLSVTDNPFDSQEIAKTKHKIEIATPMRMGYSLVVNTTDDDNDLDGRNGNIPAMSSLDELTLPENSWGYAIEQTDGLHWHAVPNKNMPGGYVDIRSGEVGSDDFSQIVYYGVNASELTRAGKYSTAVNYTVTAKIPANPVFVTMTPNEHNINNDGEVLKFDGYNLDKTWLVYIDFNRDGAQTGSREICDIDEAKSNDTHMECRLPKYSEIGKYEVIISRTDGKGPAYFRGTVAYYYQPELQTVAPGMLAIKKSTKLVDVANAGHDNKLYLTDDGEVYVVGSDYYIKNDVSDYTGVVKPMPVYFSDKGSDNPIIDIAAYNGNYYAVAKYGELYAWGVNNHRQLGIDAGGEAKSPTKVNLGNIGVVRKVVAGENFAIILTATGVYGFGNNDNFRLGCGVASNGGCNVAETYVPQSLTKVLNHPLNPGDEIIGIAAGQAHGLMLSKYGRVYSWGSHNNGQLGWNTNSDANRPHEITDELTTAHGSNIVKVAVGDNFSAALTADGHILAWGGNDAGQLGNGPGAGGFRIQDITNRFNLTNGKISNLMVAGKSVAAIANTGTVYAWGDNANNRLGIAGGATVDVPTQVPGLTGVSQFYPGTDVTASTDNDEIYQYNSVGGWVSATTDFTHPAYLLKLTGKNMNKVASVWVDFNGNSKNDEGEGVGEKYFRHDFGTELTAQISTKSAVLDKKYNVYVVTRDGRLSVLFDAVTIVKSPLLPGMVTGPNSIYNTIALADNSNKEVDAKIDDMALNDTSDTPDDKLSNSENDKAKESGGDNKAAINEPAGQIDVEADVGKKSSVECWEPSGEADSGDTNQSTVNGRDGGKDGDIKGNNEDNEGNDTNDNSGSMNGNKSVADPSEGMSLVPNDEQRDDCWRVDDDDVLNKKDESELTKPDSSVADTKSENSEFICLNREPLCDIDRQLQP